MHAISATDASLKLTSLLSKAQREPVIIRHNQRDVAVMLSVTEYQRLNKRPSASARIAQIDPKLVALLDACD
ncbi:MAG TPA: type II toxin-antitoxin system Phd/YefM family antitoxin [Acidobacteriaceae bacterium]